jgi:hypothetical protein
MCRIFDIRQANTPDLPERAFVLDTHVLLWAFYSRCAITKAYQKTVYPEFIKHLIATGQSLHITTMNLNEMLHFIEKNECDIYNQLHGKNLSVKRFRQLPEKRALVQSEARLILRQIAGVRNITVAPITVDEAILDAFVGQMTAHSCDFFDYFLLDYCNQNGYALVTDDADYAANTLIATNIYTANPNLLRDLHG